MDVLAAKTISAVCFALFLRKAALKSRIICLVFMQERLMSEQKHLSHEQIAHEAWAELVRESPRAAELMHHLSAQIGDNNAVVISQQALAVLMNRSTDTVKRALKLLEARNWIEIRQVGERGTVNAYVLNCRVAWSKPRDGIRYSKFSATVVASSIEQSDEALLGIEPPLMYLPTR